MSDHLVLNGGFIATTQTRHIESLKIEFAYISIHKVDVFLRETKIGGIAPGNFKGGKMDVNSANQLCPQ